ncbi:hypothetical protein HAX54_010101 [Datura stramonium]|uniref:Ubiquitin-like domain-containing protein n=1 Tax=Datura stramonium TaxID=4076 RepID=A0ABS8TH63_DATST|nr:hypothetical protein [Datura stramonium]
MWIIIQDDTYRDMNNWKSLSKFFLPSTLDVAKEGDRSESKHFFLMVEPDDIIAVVKAYIQEEKEISFEKQTLLNEDGFKLTVESDDTIADVKATIQEKGGIRFYKQRLFYGG